MSGETVPDRMRIGSGYDAHRLVTGRPLVLGGVTVPHHLGLEGHSDADALTHAIMDALLGAAALGDIGRFFGSDDPTLAGVVSIRLLEQVAGMLRDADWVVGNVDATIIAQAPRLAPHAAEMRERIASALGVGVEQVSVKATTTDRLGPWGREEGIAAEAVCLLRRAAPASERAPAPR
ncbi:MAG: 2-C-methyl-D-erythritol 2,4-cyclodiphosphate synthase [Chloroflexota bacterium]|nr:2-C-methyl-D-erythritol 2,4-cyclodiphosphate synthase [Chloroflexota bacterium]